MKYQINPYVLKEQDKPYSTPQSTLPDEITILSNESNQRNEVSTIKLEDTTLQSVSEPITEQVALPLGRKFQM